MSACQYCTRSFSTSRGKIAHERFHCPNRPKNPGNTNGIPHEHTWRLLSSSNPVELAAIRAGNNKVCPECLEVR